MPKDIPSNLLWPIWLFLLQISSIAAAAISPPHTLASFLSHGRVNDWLRLPKEGGEKEEWLVLGAVNRLYVLDAANLSLAHETVTGPVLDSPFCNSELTSCIGPRESIVEMDTWSKLLIPLVTKSAVDALLICGSTRQGECHLRQFPSLERLQRHPLLSGHWQHIPVAANAPESSSSALLAGDRLFVASTSSHEESPYRETFPAVATRLLSDGLQPVHAGSLDGEAAVHIRTEFRSRLRVRYLLSFRDQFFVYWLAVQPKSPHSGSPLVTRLIRICLEDDRYTSYSELELQCRNGEDNALFGVAKAGQIQQGGEQLWTIFADSEGQRSAICAFSLAKLRLTFWYNIDRCRGGADSIGLPHIGRDAKCTNRSHLPLSEDTCLLGVGGSIEASAPALAIFDDEITALDVAELDGHLLLAAGTQSGQVLQMEAIGDRANRRLQKYADFRAAADPIQQIAILGEQQKLLIAADKEVLLLRLSICDDNNNVAGGGNCTNCLNAGDPVCAWCLPLGRCTRPSACPSQAILHQCPRPIGPLIPENISISARFPGPILLPIIGLPSNGQFDLECIFGQTGLRSRARLRPEGVECPLPRERLRMGPSSRHQGAMKMSMALRAMGTQMDLVAFGNDQKDGIGEGGLLTLYACDAHKLCSACANSPWPCRWCATQRKCVDAVDFGSQCPREARGQPIGCARILPPAPGFELLVPADSAAKNISLEFAVENLSSQLPLGCRIAGGQIHLASILDGKVRCVPGQQIGEFDNDQNVGIKNLTLELLAGNEPVDATIVSVYKCANLASDCSRCVGLDPRFACSWCEGGCRHSDRCQRRPAGALAADELCTAPAIHSFSPKSGPIEGGTLVEIRGRDLGSKQQDIQDRVRVAGIPCRVIDYEVSERIICRTGPTTQSAEGEMAAGPIRITIGRSGRRSVESPSQLGHFQYRNPQPRSVQPAFGPKSGGTRLDIFGQFLDVGTNVSVHLDNIECEIRERMSDQLSCLTGPSPRPYTVTAIRLQFDGAIRLISGAKFEYRPDPTVRDIQPRMVPESGGRNLTVFGTNFDSILAPKLFLLSPPIVAGANADEWELISELGACQVENATQMRCQSPRLALPTALLRQSQMARWTVGFAMDGVKPVQNMGPTMQLTTVPDPQFSPFAAGVHQLQPDQPLMLTGQWLSQAAEPDEFWVGIGRQRCPVFLLEPDRLLCRPPPTPPLPTDDSGMEMADGRPLVVVRIGRSRAEIGALEYAQSGKAGAPIWTGRMAAGAILAFLALAMALAGLGWIWRRRQGEHERTYRRIQLQMEQMESQVRQECKQAFADLQIDVLSELDGSGNGADESTNSLGTINGGTFGASSIPLLDRREFLARLLLRDSADPAVLASFGGCGGSGIYSSQLPMALAQFDALLWNRPFLYVLVQMAEEDTSIGGAERSMLSSLLLVALSRNWAFASDVVLSLLSAHIQRCIHTNQAHLLFRHSDSLVEKLFQNWLTISLLPWLHCPSKGPTRPFFLLYKALKSLTEKGPIDAITGQARYSLSELSLLREPIEPVQLTLLVVPLDGFDQAPVKVRALDCDTIGQLKSKLLDTLYKNVPFSQRIGHDQFDLEWRCPRRGAVLLLDDDQPQQRAPRPLNTLAHYAVPDLALLAMQSRPMVANQQFTFRSGSSDHSSSFTLGWRSSANQLLSASSSSSSSDSSASPPSAQQSSSHSDSVYFHICPPTHFMATGKKTSKSAENGSKRLSSSTTTTSSTQPILPEVLLTRLLMCKGTLQRFVDAFIQSVQFADGQSVPTVLKYVFDFLDAQAEQHPKSIDEDILHAWKSNCWVLRFWQQILHNPDLLFDVPRQPCLAGSLAVLGQTLVDSFSRADLALGKESPSSKLLFAREIAKYRPFAAELFRRIRAQPPMSSQHFYDYAATLSKLASDGLSSRAALNELLNWSKGNGLRLVECLDSDPEARRLRLGDRLRQIVESSLLESEKPIGGPDEHVYASIR